ncbi:MAG: hypothetical protein CL524_14865 [Aequorivita sp.]|nr:hypothetical protein [Aequorivita sp.]|tara:strand:+ start:204 stop:401 length:198 start_codon:yes stop_codon:yes gene_type:complete
MGLFLYNVIMFVVQVSPSAEGPPPPSQNRGGQLPIDDHIWILFVAGILLGAYIFYKRSRVISKAS